MPVTSLRFVGNRAARWLAWDAALHELVCGTGLVFAVKAVGTALGFGVNVLLARKLGADGAGLLHLSLTIVLVGMMLGRLGLETSVVRFTAECASRRDWPGVVGLHRLGLRLGLVVSLCMALLVFGLAPFLAGAVFSKPLLVEPLRWMAPVIATGSLLLILSAALRGLEWIPSAAIVENVPVPLVNLLCLWAFGDWLGVSGAAACQTLAGVLALGLGWRLWTQAVPSVAPSRWRAGPLVRSGLPVLWIGCMDLALNYSGTILLGMWGRAADVAVFNVAFRTAMLTSFLLTAINSVVAPKFAALHAQGDRDGLQLLARRTAGLAVLLASPLLLVLLLFPERILSVFGTEFVAGGPVLRVLAVGQFVNAATGSVGCLLLMTGHERLMRNNITAMTMLSLVLGVLLVPRFGGLGAAVAAAVSVIGLNLVAVEVARHKLSFVPLPRPSWG